MRPATDAEILRWDDLVSANPGGPQSLQSRAWGEFKIRWGWRPRYLIQETGDAPIAVLVLSRKLPGIGEILYAPKGPSVATAEQLLSVLEDRSWCREAVVLKVEPEIERSDAAAALWRNAGLLPAPRDIQISSATILVDLARDEDELLASFKPKCRYNVRLAARKGVTVRAAEMTDANIDTMYALLSSAFERADFIVRPRDYYRDYWRLQAASDQGQLFFAEWQGKVLCGAFITWLGDRAWYKDGGSTREHAEVMAPHALQWEVMRWLRGRGITTYDLVAAPPPEGIDPSHRMYGLYRFKSGFSDQLVAFPGTWDLPLRQRRYALWNRAGQRLADQWSYRVRHDLFY